MKNYLVRKCKIKDETGIKEYRKNKKGKITWRKRLGWKKRNENEKSRENSLLACWHIDEKEINTKLKEQGEKKKNGKFTTKSKISEDI